MAKSCLDCNIQFDDTTNFCTRCGRPTEVGFGLRPIEDAGLSAWKRITKAVEENDKLMQQQGYYYTCGNKDI